MATTPKISIRLGLDGKEEVVSGLGEIKSKGLDTFNALKNTAGSALADGGRKANEQLKLLGLHSIESKKGVEAFRESLHVARPILEEAGLGLGNLGAFAAASRAGLAGLAAALTGSVVLALAKVGDQAKDTKAKIEDVFGAAAGAKVTELIRERAKALGVSPESLVGPIQKIEETKKLRGGPQVVSVEGKEQFAPFGAGAGQESLAAATTFEQIGRVHGLAPGEGIKAADEFFGAFRKQAAEQPGKEPRLTIPQVEGLPRGIGNELTQALGRGPDITALIRQLKGGAQITQEQILQATHQIAPQIEKRFQALTPEQGTVAGHAAEAKARTELLLGPAGERTSTSINRIVDSIPKALELLQQLPELRTHPIVREPLPPFRDLRDSDIDKIQQVFSRFLAQLRALNLRPLAERPSAIPGGRGLNTLLPLLSLLPSLGRGNVTPSIPSPPAPAQQQAGGAVPAPSTTLPRVRYGSAPSVSPTASATTPESELAGEITDKALSLSGAYVPFGGIKETPEFYSPAVTKPEKGAPGTYWFDKEGQQKFAPHPGTEGPIRHAPGDHWFDAQGRNLTIPEVPQSPGYQEHTFGTHWFDKEGDEKYIPSTYPPISSVPPGLPGAGLSLPPSLATPITFPPQPPGLTQFLGGPYAPSAQPLSIPTSAPSPSTAQLSSTVDTAPLKRGADDAGNALEGLASRIRNIQFPSPASAGGAGSGGAGEASAPAAQGQALGGIIGFSEGGSLGVMPRLPSYVTKFRMGGLAGLPGFAEGGHILARVSTGEHFFPPKEVAAIGLPALHAMNSFAGGGRIHGPGTGTSDSILASLPRGGFVLNARAVGAIGEQALGHLHAMADGGHVDHFSGLQGSPVAMPSLNGNKGHNDGSGDFHLHWPDGSSTSMPMARDVLDELSEKSALYRIASGGRRSSAQS